MQYKKFAFHALPSIPLPPFRCSPLPFSLLHPLMFALSLCPTLAHAIPSTSSFLFAVHHPFFHCYTHSCSPSRCAQLWLPSLQVRFTCLFAVHHFPFRCDTRSCSPFVTPSRCAQLSLPSLQVKFTCFSLFITSLFVATLARVRSASPLLAVPNSHFTFRR